MKRVKAFLGATLMLGVLLFRYAQFLADINFFGVESFGLYFTFVMLVLGINATMFSLFSLGNRKLAK